MSRRPSLPIGSRIVTLVAITAFAACSATGGVERDRSRPPTDTADRTEAGDPPPETTSTTPGPGAPATTALPPFEPAPIEWDAFNERVDLGTLDVPVDYADPDGDRFELFVARFRALDPERRIGSLLVNPGGPGLPGTDFAVFAAQIFDRELLERFDIVAWDPRGTGESDPPIDCIDDYDPYFAEIDGTPETDAERDHLVEVAEDLARRCVANNLDTFQFVGTNNSARDIDALRRALGEDQISYFGFSYGSELGATWATLFPGTVRAAVLDGASDPDADPLEQSLDQLRGFERALATFLERCDAEDECAFHSDGRAAAAFDALMQALDDDPIPSLPGRPPVNRDVAITAVIQSMYTEQLWPALEQALADARAGDGSGLMALSDGYFRRSPDGTWSNGIEALQVITCADDAERLTVAEEDALAPRYTEVAPRIAPEGTRGGYFCSFLPEALDPRITITGQGAGPIVVIGTTGDPATPLESTVGMADALDDGRLVIVEADQHTGYGVNRCVVDVVNEYLVELSAPEDGTECR